MARRVKALAAVARVAGKARLRMAGTLLVHAGILLTLAGGVIRLCWSERGTIQFREGEQTAFFNSEDQQRMPLPFTLQLVKFEVERYPAPAAAQSAAPEVQAETLAIQWSGEDAGEELPVACRYSAAFRILSSTRPPGWSTADPIKC